MPRALITGIAGFAAGHLAEHLLACGDTVLGCSLGDAAGAIAGKIPLVSWDLSGDDGLPPAARRAIDDFQPDRIYHLAAMSIPGDCGPDQPTPQAVAVNVLGTRRVLQLASSLASRPRVLVTSSCLVYAAVNHAAPRVSEDSPLDPRTGYSRSKLLAEEEVFRAVAHGNVDVVIARPFHHTGPRQTARLMLSQWAKELAAGGEGPMEIYTRDAWLDLTDVRDTVRAYRMLLTSGQSGAIYNVGRGENVSSGAILDELQRHAGSQRPVVETRPGLKQEPVADTRRLVAATGWQPQIPLARTVADVLAWWKAEFRDRRADA